MSRLVSGFSSKTGNEPTRRQAYMYLYTDCTQRYTVQCQSTYTCVHYCTAVFPLVSCRRSGERTMVEHSGRTSSAVSEEAKICYRSQSQKVFLLHTFTYLYSHTHIIILLLYNRAFTTAYLGSMRDSYFHYVKRFALLYVCILYHSTTLHT